VKGILDGRCAGMREVWLANYHFEHLLGNTCIPKSRCNIMFLNHKASW
jgi:hypothetical protein